VNFPERNVCEAKAMSIKQPRNCKRRCHQQSVLLVIDGSELIVDELRGGHDPGAVAAPVLKQPRRPPLGLTVANARKVRYLVSPLPISLHRVSHRYSEISRFAE
jgi:hypothetical protein